MPGHILVGGRPPAGAQISCRGWRGVGVASRDPPLTAGAPRTGMELSWRRDPGEEKVTVVVGVR